MTTGTTTATGAAADVAVVRSVFEAFANRDLAAISDLFHDGATWNHRNGDRFGGLHHGSDGIVAYLAEVAHLTAGTLRPVPQAYTGDGQGRVCVLVWVSGTRPDGRAFDDPQVTLFMVDDGQVRTFGQFVGGPAAVSVFWA